MSQKAIGKYIGLQEYCRERLRTYVHENFRTYSYGKIEQNFSLFYQNNFLERLNEYM